MVGLSDTYCKIFWRLDHEYTILCRIEEYEKKCLNIPVAEIASIILFFGSDSVCLKYIV